MNAGRTMMGGIGGFGDPPPAVAAPAGLRANQTMMGMPADFGAPGPPPAAAPAFATGSPMVAASPYGALGQNGPAPSPAGAPRPPWAHAPNGGGTLLGVARPGIAPLAPGEEDDEDPDSDEDDPPGYAPVGELGATMGPLPGPPSSGRGNAAMRKRLVVRGPRARKGAKVPPPRASKRAMTIMFAAGGLALAAVLFALLWPSAPPLTARARADAEGHEGVELRCSNCPDGTKATIGDRSVDLQKGAGLLTLPAALAVGDNQFKVTLDRPGGGRHETINVAVHVAYRIRPDLTSLAADRPSIQIVAEGVAGTAITLDGKPVALVAGHAVETIDVSAECTGSSVEPKTISRKLAYTVKPVDGPEEQGTVNVSVGVAPLALEAPGAQVTIDGPSFLLAGRAAKGSEVLAAGRPIAMRPDGTFAQVMNVSAVGATQIEVRAKFPGYAPRLVPIKVRRVDSLDSAAKEFLADKPINFAPLLAGIGPQIGKNIAITGEVSEARKQGAETVILLDVATASGCTGGAVCNARLLRRSDDTAKKGDVLRVYGHVARAFSVAGRADIPEIEVDFVLKGAK